MKNNKLFITFEGIDGCGKDTQLHRLCEQIREDDNYPFGNKYSTVWITREPTKFSEEGKSISRKIREGNVSKEEATRLYITDRKKHSKIISDFLKHSTVLCSRYDLSTLSYQMTQGMSFEDLYKKHDFNQPDGVLVPDITLVFLLSETKANQRISSRNSVHECFEDRSFQQKLEENLIYCIDELKKKGRKIITINADAPIEEVTKEMFEKINYMLQQEFS